MYIFIFIIYTYIFISISMYIYLYIHHERQPAASSRVDSVCTYPLIPMYTHTHINAYIYVHTHTHQGIYANTVFGDVLCTREIKSRFIKGILYICVWIYMHTCY